MSNKIAIASDHAGFELKQDVISYLNKKNIDVIDLGTDPKKALITPDFANKLADEIKKIHLLLEY